MYEQALRDLGAKAYRNLGGGVEANNAAMISYFMDDISSDFIRLESRQFVLEASSLLMA